MTSSTCSASPAIPRRRRCSTARSRRLERRRAHASGLRRPAGLRRPTTTSAGSPCSGTRSTRAACAAVPGRRRVGRRDARGRPRRPATRGWSPPSPCSPRSASSTRPTRASTSTPCPTPDRMSHLFAKGVPEPFVDRFSELGPDDGPVARYLSDVAAASLLWPLGDRGSRGRLHRITCPRLSLWGEQDELLPVGVSAAWAAGGVPGRDHRRRRPSARVGRTRRGRRPPRRVPGDA